MGEMSEIKGSRKIATEGNPKILPVQFCFQLLCHLSENKVNCVWLRITTLEVDCNLKKLTLCFEDSPLFLGKIARNLLRFVLPLRK